MINGQNITVSSGVDILFGRRGFFSYIQDVNKSIEDILGSCKDDLNLYKENYKKYWLYNVNGDRKADISSLHELKTDNLGQ